jgi:hypothetical protein
VSGKFTVYNFEVADNHDYFVGKKGVLVHNNNCQAPGGYLAGKAPKQVQPGIRELEGQYVNDQGRVEPWKAYYDEYGRLEARTDYNAGNKAQKIPNVHHHTYEYSQQFPTGKKVKNHSPGNYIKRLRRRL